MNAVRHSEDTGPYFGGINIIGDTGALDLWFLYEYDYAKNRCLPSKFQTTTDGAKLAMESVLGANSGVFKVDDVETFALESNGIR